MLILPNNLRHISVNVDGCTKHLATKVTQLSHSIFSPDHDIIVPL